MKLSASNAQQPQSCLNLTTRKRDKAIKDFQDRTYHSEYGHRIRLAAQMLGVELNPAQVTVINQLMQLQKNRKKDMTDRISVAARLWWRFISGFDVRDYDNSDAVKKLMTAFFKKNFSFLQEAMIFNIDWNWLHGEGYGRCRQFEFTLEFADAYKKVVHRNLLNPAEFQAAYDPSSYRLKPAKSDRAFRFQRKKLNPELVAAVDKLRTEASFRINKRVMEPGYLWEAANLRSKTFKQLESIEYTLRKLNLMASSEQYHGQVFVQSAGRLHVENGLMFLPSEVRKAVMAPEAGNVFLEADMRCAQLRLLCDVLDCPEVKQKIDAAIAQGKDPWSLVGESSISRNAKKLISYIFAFSSSYSPTVIAQLANEKLENEGDDSFRVTHSMVAECLVGLLAPTLPAKKNFVKQFTKRMVLDRKCPRYIENAVEQVLDVWKLGDEYYNSDECDCQEEEECDCPRRQRRRNAFKIAGMVLAHLCQGLEQSVILPVLVKCPYEFTLLQYDGMTIEVPPERVEEAKQWLLDAFGDVPIKIEEFTPPDIESRPPAPPCNTVLHSASYEVPYNKGLAYTTSNNIYEGVASSLPPVPSPPRPCFLPSLVL